MMKLLFELLFITALVFLLAACSSKPVAKGTTELEEVGPWLRQKKMTQEEVNAPIEEVSISTTCGDIIGVKKDGYTEFRSVRYATSERFEAPVLVTKWDGVFDATVWGDRCFQYQGLYGTNADVTGQFYADEALITWPAVYSEDCLNLNIWTPDGSENCPVLIYIHGGAFVGGSNSTSDIDGAVYARNGIITIAINYRLGAFHSAYGDGYTGYLAIQDQAAALHWVRDNITDYGGDPSKITLMGESAGAISTQNLLASPLVEDGLVSGAIMMSGAGDFSSLGYPTVSSMVEPVWTAMKRMVDAESIADLKALSTRELYSLWINSLGEYSSTAALPIINGVGMTEGIDQAFNDGSIKDVPCIIGMLSEDVVPYSLYKIAVDYAQNRAEAGGEPVYLYYFDRNQPGENDFGAFHGADLYYVFGTLYRNWRPFDETDYRIAEDMIAYISNFVKTGDPNGDGLAVWEAATTERQEFMRFGDDEAAMYAPSPDDLIHTQNTNPPFPYAKHLNGTPTDEAR